MINTFIRLFVILLFFCGATYAQQNFPQRISIGIHHAPPLSYADNQARPSGLIIDILDVLAKELDFSLQIIPCPFPRCLKMVKEGEIDLLGELIYTEDRAQELEYVYPAYMVLHSSFVFYALHNSDIKVDNYQQLSNKRIAVMRGAAYFPKFDQDKALQKVPLDTERVVVEMLLKGRVDLAISVEATADQSMGVLNQPSQRLKKLEYRYKDEILGHAVMSKKFAASPLADKFRMTYQRFAQQGRFDEILARYNLPIIATADISQSVN